MKYSIIYRSNTGNTAQLARKIRDCLPEGAEVTCGPPSTETADAGLIFVGFWTNQGGCDESIAAFLQKLRYSKVFLFGTAGFGGDPAYFAQILSRVTSHLDRSNTVVGSYMCQGKMPLSVRKKYENMAASDPNKAAKLLKNFDQALPHPNPADLERLEGAVAAVLGL